VEQALEAFPARVRRLGAAARRRLHDSGIVGTTLDYPFGLPMARWLLAREDGGVEVQWRQFREHERLEEILSLLVTRAEEDAFTEGGAGWREWLRAATSTGRTSALEVLAGLFDHASLPEDCRDWLFESLGLPILWRLGTLALSRTGAKRPCERPVFHPRGLRRGKIDVAGEVNRPLPALCRASRADAHALIETARLAMATRQRELHCFSYPNPDDVWVADPGHGIRIALFGIRPEFRQPFEGYYGFLALKNGVPVSYGGAWCLLDTVDFALNVFPSFRQGESTFLMSQILRVYRQFLGRTTFAIDPYQLGNGNDEALRSGAFYFYQRAGFRPHAHDVLAVLRREQAEIARDRSYRSPLAVLRRLARDEISLSLAPGHPEPTPRVRAAQLALLVTGWIAREFGGDRVAATRAATDLTARALGAPRWRSWPQRERRVFGHWALVVAQIPDLARWPAGDKRGLIRTIRAKGSPSEVDYVRLLARQRRLHQTLAALIATRTSPHGRGRTL